MKNLPFTQIVDYLGNMPGDESVSVFYYPFGSKYSFFVVKHGEEENEIPIGAKLICVGQPGKFFDYFDILLINDNFKSFD